MLQLKQYTSLATAYLPKPKDGYISDAEARMEGGDEDRFGFILYTPEEHLRNRSPFSSVAMDHDAFPYGTALYCPEICDLYGVPHDAITFLVVDTGGAFNLPGRNTGRIDFAVGTREMEDKVGNMRPVTLWVMEEVPDEPLVQL